MSSSPLRAAIARGVERAVETVERALALYGAPVYVRKQIVHNSHVVRDLEARGAVFVDSLTTSRKARPSSSRPTASRRPCAAQRRARLTTIDATCPLVTKVHTQARRYADAGYTIVLIGHAGHEEVEGTLGEAPEAIVLVQSAEDAEHVSLPADRPLAYITQTTLSVDETSEIIAVLRRRFPRIEGPAREDICYATSNRPVGGEGAARRGRSAARRRLAQLVQLATPRRRRPRRAGVAPISSTTLGDIDEAGSTDCETVGLTSGASAPERLVAECARGSSARGADVSEQAPVHEDVSFKLPVELRRAERSAA